MGEKVTFDEVNKIINITSAPVLIDGDWVIDIDFKEHIYSDGKVDWLANQNFRRRVFPVRPVGGDALPGSKALGSTFFLASDWKIRPYEADHVFRLNGNVYSEDGTSPFTSTIGTYSVMIINTVSSLVDSTVQQLQELQYTAYQDAVWLDIDSGNSGVEYPAGTREYPVNNWEDAITICTEKGFAQVGLLSNTTLDSTNNIEGMTVFGASATSTSLHILTSALTQKAIFKTLTISGVLDGGSEIHNCIINELAYFNGQINHSMINGPITLGGNAVAHIHGCYSGIPGQSTPEINMGGSGNSLALRAYDGGVLLTNKTGTDSVSVDLNSGQVKLEAATVINGTIVCRGVGKVIDSVTGYLLPAGTTTWNTGVTLVNETSVVYYNDISYTEKWIYIDTESLENGNGKSSTPFNSISDAVDFAERVGWYKLMFLSDVKLERTLKNFTIEGIGLPTIDFNGQNVNKSEFIKVGLTGLQVGSITAREVMLLPGLTGLNGVYKESGIGGDVVCAEDSIVSMASMSTLFITSHVHYAIDMGASNNNVKLNIRKLSGAIKIQNCNHADKLATIAFSSGHIELDSTNTAGEIGIAGIPDNAIIDNSGVGCTVLTSGVFPGAQTISNTVWTSNEAVEILTLLGNRVTKSGEIITIYEDDETTVWKQFDLTGGGRVEV